MKRVNVKEYFPKNYDESRKYFLNLTEKISDPKESGSWKIESKKHDDLTVDHVWLPPTKRPETLLVFLTGIHGSETYTGAAVLNLFIEEILPTLNRDNLGIFMVHAMNPYGFKNHKRYTENNINLNRNFSISGDIFKSKNPDSKKMCDLLLARKPVSSLTSKLLQNLKKEKDGLYYEGISLDQIVKGIAPGQFERPMDLEYGGTGLEPQTKALIERMQKLMPQFKDVIAMDIHTGLGDEGRLHMLTDGDKKSLHPELFEQIFKTQEDHDFYVFTPATAKGFYPVQGATNSMFSELAKDDQRVCAVTLEFGTIGHSQEQQLDGFNRALIEHDGHHYGYADEKLEREARHLNFTRSYPDDDKWRKSVLEAAEGMILRVLQRI